MSNAYLYRTQAGMIFHNEIKLKRKVEKEPTEKRKPKANPTRESVINENNNIATRRLAVLLDANFCEGDSYITLTYKNPSPTQKEAKRHLHNFIKAMRREYAKQGKPFEWVSVTSHGGHRVHHHMIMKSIDTATIAKHWTHGLLSISPLAGDDYTPIARYFINHTRDYYDRETYLNTRRYNCSRNLERPLTDREHYQHQPGKEIKPKRDCYIIPGSLEVRVNPITGAEHITYREKRFNEEARRKRRKRKNTITVKPQRFYTVPPGEQLSIPLQYQLE